MQCYSGYTYLVNITNTFTWNTSEKLLATAEWFMWDSTETSMCTCPDFPAAQVSYILGFWEKITRHHSLRWSVYREAWKFEYDEKVTGGALQACSYKGRIPGVGFGVCSKGCITVNSDRYLFSLVFLFALRLKWIWICDMMWY